MSQLLDHAPDPNPLRRGEKYTVFLSYRSVNRIWVIALYDALVSAGHTVFLDQFRLVPGRVLDEEITDALKASQAGVLVWSTAAKDSVWVEKEYTTMQSHADDARGFYFVPLRLDKSDLPGTVNARLFLDFSDYPEGPNGGELLRLLHGVVGEPLSDEAVRFCEQLAEQTHEARAEIDAARHSQDAEWLTSLAATGGVAWECSPQLGAHAAEALIRIGDTEAALTVLENLDDSFPRALRPKQLLAHALTRLETPQSVKKAQRILATLYAKHHRDPETLGLYGKTFYVQYLASGADRDSRNGHLLRKSRNMYREGFDNSSDDTYCGINTATKTLLLGGQGCKEEAHAVAAEVLERLPETVVQSLGYWELATIAEAHLIRQDIPTAAHAYQRAVDAAPGEEASHRSTRGSMRDLCDVLDLGAADRAVLEEPFQYVSDLSLPL